MFWGIGVAKIHGFIGIADEHKLAVFQGFGCNLFAWKRLKLRLDLSLRKQASISRDIATMTSSANSGNTAFKLAFSADYTVSRLLTMSFYYDRQTNTPLLSSSSYPTTTQDFGLSMKFSLTR